MLGLFCLHWAILSRPKKVQTRGKVPSVTLKYKDHPSCLSRNGEFQKRGLAVLQCAFLTTSESVYVRQHDIYKPMSLTLHSDTKKTAIYMNLQISQNFSLKWFYRYLRCHNHAFSLCQKLNVKWIMTSILKHHVKWLLNAKWSIHMWFNGHPISLMDTKY